jgi:hypothetical protein
MGDHVPFYLGAVTAILTVPVLWTARHLINRAETGDH